MTKKVIHDGGLEHNWLADHPEELSKYPGQYIAVVGERIVAHGSEFGEVYEKAKKFGEDPLFMKVPEEEVLAL